MYTRFETFPPKFKCDQCPHLAKIGLRFYCENKEAVDKVNRETLSTAEVGEIQVGKDDYVPEWCPLLTDKDREMINIPEVKFDADSSDLRCTDEVAGFPEGAYGGVTDAYVFKCVDESNEIDKEVVNDIIEKRKDTKSNVIFHTDGAESGFNQVKINDILHEVSNERKKQHAKWGKQNHSLPEWFMILDEEIGEAKKEAVKFYNKEKIYFNGADFPASFFDQNQRFDNLRKEMIQSIAVMVQIVEAIDGGVETKAEIIERIQSVIFRDINEKHE